MKQPNFIWVSTLWVLLTIIARPGWLVFASGLTVCLLLMYLRTPGEFWHLMALPPWQQARRERYLVRSVAHKPGTPHPYHRLGMLLCQRQEWSTAIPLFEEAVTRHGDKCPPALRLSLATAYRENRQETLAIPLLREMITRGVRRADIYYHLALCLRGVQDMPAALDAATEAHALGPQAVRPVMIMGHLHFALGDFAAAKRDYQWLIRMLPKPAESLYWLGRAELALGDIQPAMEHLHLAVVRIREHQDISTIPLGDALHWLNAAADLQSNSAPPSLNSSPA